jgi:hypothetical protein
MTVPVFVALATVETRNTSEDIVAPTVALAGFTFDSSQESKLRRSVLFCCIWQESGFTHRVFISPFNFDYRDFFNFCFYWVFKENYTVNCVSLAHRKFSFPSAQVSWARAARIIEIMTYMYNLYLK